MPFFEAIYVIGCRWKDSAIVTGNVVAVVVSASCHVFRYILKKGLKDIPLDLCLRGEEKTENVEKGENTFDMSPFSLKIKHLLP